MCIEGILCSARRVATPRPPQRGKIPAMTALLETIAAEAARLIVDDGMSYGAAKARARDTVGAPPRAALPDNDLIEAHVRDHIALFHAETQGAELAALRRLALAWMDRLAEFRPYVCGAVWNGTATRRTDIHLQLFCDDPKAAELALVNHDIRYAVQSMPGVRGATIEVLSFSTPCRDLAEDIGVHLMVHDYDDLRGTLKTRAGKPPVLGSRDALQARLAQEATS